MVSYSRMVYIRVVQNVLGIPSRTAKNFDMKVRTYSLMTIPFEIVLRREEAILEKGIRQHVLRKILFQ